MLHVAFNDASVTHSAYTCIASTQERRDRSDTRTDAHHVQAELVLPPEFVLELELDRYSITEKASASPLALLQVG